MAITRVQFNGITGISTTPAVTFSSTTTAGNLLIAFVAASTSNAISAPSGWSTAVTVTGVQGIPGAIFYKENASATTTVTAAIAAGGGRYCMTIAEYSGIVTSSSLDQTAIGIPNSSSPLASGTVNTLASNEALIACYTNNFDDTFSTPTSGFTLVDQRGSGAQTASCYTDLIVSSAGSYSSSIQVGTGGDGMIATFIGAGGSTAVPGNAIWMGDGF